MRCLNTDGDGKVDFDEFRTIMQIILDEFSFNQNKSKWVKLLFNLFDKDEDGILTWDDLSEMASSRMYKIDPMLEQIYMFVVEFLNNQLVNNSNTDTNNINEIMNYYKFEEEIEERQLSKTLIEKIRVTVKKNLKNRIMLLNNIDNCFSKKLD